MIIVQCIERLREFDFEYCVDLKCHKNHSAAVSSFLLRPIKRSGFIIKILVKFVFMIILFCVRNKICFLEDIFKQFRKLKSVLLIS